MDPEATSKFDWRRVRKILLRWEYLRLVYNAALVILVVALVATLRRPDTDWVHLGQICAVGAVIANLCYFAGPAAEAYLAWLGVKLPGVTMILFSLGLVFALGLAAIAVLTSLGTL